MALGAIVARELYSKVLPIAVVSPERYRAVSQMTRAFVDTATPGVLIEER